jgi:hypothetical protein
MSTPFSEPIHGYPRAQVEEFLSAAAAERVRLESEIADANARIARARAAVGTHRVMVAMLLETQRELSETRRRAEQEAERILADAEIEARAIERGVPSIDLSEPPAPVSATIPPTATPSVPLAGHVRNDDDNYFEFLRGALADDQPLGPRPE